MGRQVKMIPSYTRDASYLMSLAASVEADERHPTRWREDLAQRLKECSILMLQTMLPLDEEKTEKKR